MAIKGRTIRKKLTAQMGGKGNRVDIFTHPIESGKRKIDAIVFLVNKRLDVFNK